MTSLPKDLRKYSSAEKFRPDDNVIISNVRHKNMLYKAIEALDRALVTIETRMPEDFISMDLQTGTFRIGRNNRRQR